jgi:hypothetical protein
MHACVCVCVGVWEALRRFERVRNLDRLKEFKRVREAGDASESSRESKNVDTERRVRKCESGGEQVRGERAGRRSAA